MSALTARFSLPRRLPRNAAAPGITAIIVKELRGRMRGRRAFIVVTLYVLLLAVFAWMFERMNEESLSQFSSYGGQATFASASIGRGIFFGLLELQTLMVAVLAPAATAAAISSEREHQTLELLAVTPISSLAIVLGKLMSALAWVFVLILASIPVTALVFVFGGVAPDDVIRGYTVLFATVIGLGSVGIFFSAVTRRTGASTGLTFVATLALVVGSLFVWAFLSSTGQIRGNGLRREAGEAILWLNPFVAQADVACGTESGGFGGSCSLITGILGSVDVIPTAPFPGKPVPGFRQPAPGIGFGVGGGVVNDSSGKVGAPQPNVVVGQGLDAGGPGVSAPDAASIAQADPFRDRFWPKTVLGFLALAAILTLASVQFVTPTRRWRPSLPGPVRRLLRRRGT